MDNVLWKILSWSYFACSGTGALPAKGRHSKHVLDHTPFTHIKLRLSQTLVLKYLWWCSCNHNSHTMSEMPLQNCYIEFRVYHVMPRVFETVQVAATDKCHVKPDCTGTKRISWYDIGLL